MDSIFSTYRSVDPIPQYEEEPQIYQSPELSNPLFGLLDAIEARPASLIRDDSPRLLVKNWFNKKYVTKLKESISSTPTNYTGASAEAFNATYDNVEKRNPEAKKYRRFLTDIAYRESGFNPYIQNKAGAPAYGYFQFMLDGKKWDNITKFAGTDIETFRNNPELLIEAAIKLAKSFESGFSKEDWEKASKLGYNKWAMLAGAWLAGVGGVRKFLNGQGNPDDRHWSKSGTGTSVGERMKIFNHKEGGVLSALKGKKIDWNKLKGDPRYKKFDWKLNNKNMSIIQDSLINRGADAVEQVAVLSLVVPESGGFPDPHGNGAFGIIGWRGPRAINLPKDLPGLLHVLMEGIYNNPEAKDWTDGGKGTGIQTGQEMYNFFKTTPVVRKGVNAFMRGYVRPPKDLYLKRQEFAKLLYDYIR